MSEICGGTQSQEGFRIKGRALAGSYSIKQAQLSTGSAPFAAGKAIPAKQAEGNAVRVCAHAKDLQKVHKNA